MKKLFKLLIVMLLSVGLVSCVNKQPQEIHIFFTSDVHCGLDGQMNYASLKALVDEAKAEDKNVLLVDAGDFIQGGNLGSLTKGEGVIDIMNQLDYDVVTIGNHEFDYGIDRLKQLMDKSNFEYVVSNMTYKGSNEYFLKDTPEYVIKDVKGTKVGFIGIVTPSSITSSTPKFFMEDGEFVYDFYGDETGQRLIDKVQEVVDELRKQKVDYVIALSHLGSTAACEPYDVFNVLRNTSGIDAFLDGHSHSVIYGDTYQNKDGKETLLVSVGTKMENIGELIIDKEGNIESVLISSYDNKDEKIASLIEQENQKINDVLSEYLCDIDFDLSILKDGVRQARCREVNMGDFFTDAIRHVAESDVAICNGGGLRANIEKGQVTYGSLFDVSPFGNVLVKVEASGQQILDLLEFGSRKTEAISVFEEAPVGEFGGFIQVSGLKYTINTDVESSVVTDESGMLVSIGDNRRVSDVYILKDGEYVPIDKDAYYTVSGIDYLILSSGDGNSVLKDNENIVEDGMFITDVLKKYILDAGGISIDYMDIQDRIIIE